MKERNLELTVGVFVFLGLLTVAMMIIRFGSYGYKHESYPLTAIFSFTNGMVVGAPVRLAGVEVGKVENLVFNEKGAFFVEVRVQVRKGTLIRNDARVVINSLGIMGEKYVEFIPVSTTAPVLKPGDVIKGVTPVAMSELMEEGKKVANQIQNVISGWSDKETQDNIKKTVANLKDITGTPNKENLSQAIANFKEFSEAAKKLSVKIDDIMEKNKESLKVIGPKAVVLIDNMNKVFSSVGAGEGTIGKLIKDDSIAKDIKDFVADVKANPWKLFFRTEEKKSKEGKEVPKEGGKFLGIF